MEANCGPTSALTKLSQHTQRDNSLQNEFLHSTPQAANFRQGPTVDHRLNSEFQRFQGADVDFGVDMGQPPQFQHLQRQQQHQQQHQHQHQHQHQFQHLPHQSQNLGQQNGAWVQDFSNLSINQPKTNDWHQQFLQQNRQMPQAAPVAQFHPMRAGPVMAPTQPIVQTQQPEVHHDFDSQFDMVEKELESLEQDNEAEKAMFAETARKVENSLQSTNSAKMADKLNNSNFLKLMKSISTRQVELEGDRLVDSESKQDIRQHLSDPLAHIKNEMGPLSDGEEAVGSAHAPINVQPMSYHEPVHESENRPHVSHLPDPLAHIRDGELGGDDLVLPLQAAQIISGNQVKTSDWMEDTDWLDMTDEPAAGQPQQMKPANSRNSILSDAWQEVYDDYRHDDDYH